MILNQLVDAVESAFHFINPQTAKEAWTSSRHSGLLFSSGKPWAGLRGSRGRWLMRSSPAAWAAGNLKGAAVELGRRAKNGVKAAWLSGFKGGMITTVPLGALTFAMAPRGHKVSATAANMTSYSLAAIPGALLAGPVGGTITSLVLGPMLEHNMGTALQYVKDTGARTMRVRMGGDYLDTSTAYTMRQRAAQDMSGSLLNCRQYLGREALLMHS